MIDARSRAYKITEQTSITNNPAIMLDIINDCSIWNVFGVRQLHQVKFYSLDFTSEIEIVIQAKTPQSIGCTRQEFAYLSQFNSELKK